MIVGTEWLIEATGCEAAALRDEVAIKAIMSRVIDDLGLQTVGSVWHKFDGEGGLTGLIALTESHLACHTYPEYRIATFNLYCCRSRPEWGWDANLKSVLGALSVSITKIERGESNLQSAIRNPQFKSVGGDA
jgi:S-adenosylmethionine decarboxylase